MSASRLLRLATGAAVAAALAMPAASADAQLMQYRFTGNILSGSLPANVLGPATPALSLAGRTFAITLQGTPAVTWNGLTGNNLQNSTSDNLSATVSISGIGAIPGLGSLFGLVLNNRTGNDARVTLQYMNVDVFRLTHDAGAAASPLRDYGFLTNIGPVTGTSVAVQTPSGVALQNVAFQASAVPEPSTYALMATGLAGILGLARRRRANA